MTKPPYQSKSSNRDSGAQNTMGEAQLLTLLASLKVEETPEANFEERFLYDFHNGIARETVCCPAHLRAWEHILQYLTNFGKKRLLFGASTLGVGALAMGIMIVPSSDESASTRVQVAKRFDDTVSSLVPGLSRDCDGCTSIRISSHFDESNQSGVLGTVGSVQSRSLVTDFFYSDMENNGVSMPGNFLLSY